jgi:hypothetical protein
MPAIARIGSRAIGWLVRSVRIEYGLAIILLLVVGVQMSLSPAYQALQAQLQLGFHESYQEGQVRLDLRVAPAHVGFNDFGVDVVDNRPGADQVPATVLLRLQPNDNTAPAQVDTKQTEPGRYTARGSYFSNKGAWQVEVILRKSGFYDITHWFTVDVEQRSAVN